MSDPSKILIQSTLQACSPRFAWKLPCEGIAAGAVTESTIVSTEPEPAPVVSTELQKQQFIEPNRPDEADNAILEDLSVDSLFSNASLSTSVDDRDGNPSDQSAVEEVGQINETVGGDIITGSADLVLLDSEVRQKSTTNSVLRK